MSDKLDTDTLAAILVANFAEGYSVDVYGDIPEDGYMVGGLVMALTFPVEEISVEEISTYLGSYWLTLNRPGVYAGIWTHEGTVYVDISEKFHSRTYAAQSAKLRNELAFYDVVQQLEVAA
jgi:hypothetical protein